MTIAWWRREPSSLERELEAALERLSSSHRQIDAAADDNERGVTEARRIARDIRRVRIQVRAASQDDE